MIKSCNLSWQCSKSIQCSQFGNLVRAFGKGAFHNVLHYQALEGQIGVVGAYIMGEMSTWKSPLISELNSAITLLSLRNAQGKGTNPETSLSTALRQLEEAQVPSHQSVLPAKQSTCNCIHSVEHLVPRLQVTDVWCWLP